MQAQQHDLIPQDQKPFLAVRQFVVVFLIHHVPDVSFGRLNFGEIGIGLNVLLGVEENDDQWDLDLIAKKIADLRIFPNQEGKFDQSLRDINGEILIISQFTLCADYKKGRRPSFTKAAKPEKAEAMYREFIKILEQDPQISKVATGRFGADMQVQINNNGPVTIQIDSAQLKQDITWIF